MLIANRIISDFWGWEIFGVEEASTKVFIWFFWDKIKKSIEKELKMFHFIKFYLHNSIYKLNCSIAPIVSPNYLIDRYNSEVLRLKSWLPLQWAVTELSRFVLNSSIFIIEIHIAFPISITLFSNHLKSNSSKTLRSYFSNSMAPIST